MKEMISFTSGGKPVPAELFYPGASPEGGVIVIAYGSDGLVDNEHGPWKTIIHGYASELARKGFTVVIPDYFRRTDTCPGDIDLENGGVQQIWLHRDEWQNALADALVHARSLPGIAPTRLGLLGFSLGGYLCLRVRSEAIVLVEFFAPVLDGLGPGGGSALRAQIHHGLKDRPVRFAENATRIEQELRASGAITELFSYEGASHGFAGSDPADMKALELSKERTLSFFETHL